MILLDPKKLHPPVEVIRHAMGLVTVSRTPDEPQFPDVGEHPHGLVVTNWLLDGDGRYTLDGQRIYDESLGVAARDWVEQCVLNYGQEG